MVSAKRDLVVTRVFDAPVELVRKAWTDPEHVMRWWGPRGFTSPVAKMDLREGGTSLVCMRPAAFGDHSGTWHDPEIVPMEWLAYVRTLAHQHGTKIGPTSIGMPVDFPQDLRNAVAFKAVGDNKTKISLTEYGWPVGETMGMSGMGLEQCLERMAAILAEVK